MKRLVVALFLVALLSPARAQSLAEELEEARLVSRVKIALAEDDALRAFTFEPTAEGGAVTVRGTVETAEQKRRLAEVVGGLDGVERVVDEVRVARGARAGASDLPPVAPEPEAEAEPEPEPDEVEPEPEPEPVYHTVRSGDSLIAIARRYGVSVSQIRRLNGIRGSNIRIGQRLRVE
jgi:LysM repeat protein